MDRTQLAGAIKKAIESEQQKAREEIQVRKQLAEKEKVGLSFLDSLPSDLHEVVENRPDLAKIYLLNQLGKNVNKLVDFKHVVDEQNQDIAALRRQVSSLTSRLSSLQEKNDVLTEKQEKSLQDIRKAEENSRHETARRDQELADIKKQLKEFAETIQQ